MADTESNRVESRRNNGAANRQYPYDVVRVVAMVFVIAVHSLVMIDTSWSLGWYLFAAGQGLFFTANALFFMLSGKFNLRERKDDRALLDYYRKGSETSSSPSRSCSSSEPSTTSIPISEASTTLDGNILGTRSRYSGEWSTGSSSLCSDT